MPSKNETSGGLEVKPLTKEKQIGGGGMKVIEVDLSNLSDLEPYDTACEMLRTISIIYKKLFLPTKKKLVMLELSSEGFEKLVLNEFKIDDKVARAAAIIASYCDEECDPEELREIALTNAPVNEKYVDVAIEFLAKNIKTVIVLYDGYETCVCLSEYGEE